jgi:pheromone shutdown protein TraB
MGIKDIVRNLFEKGIVWKSYLLIRNLIVGGFFFLYGAILVLMGLGTRDATTNMLRGWIIMGAILIFIGLIILKRGWKK